MSSLPVWQQEESDEEPGSIFGVLLRAVLAFVGLYLLVDVLCGGYFAVTALLTLMGTGNLDRAGEFSFALAQWPMPLHRAALGLVVGGTIVALLRTRGIVIARPGFLLVSLAGAGLFYLLTPVNGVLEPIRAQLSAFGMEASDKRALEKREAPERFRDYLATNSRLRDLIGEPVSSRQLFAVGPRGDRIRVFCVSGNRGTAYARVRQSQSNDGLHLDCEPRKIEGTCGRIALADACAVVRTAQFAPQVIAPTAMEQADAVAPATQPEPLAEGERCIGGQRMRRVENGWVQAGVCSTN